MTQITLRCACGEEQRPQSCYCHRCGREVRPLCPLCEDERLPLASPRRYWSPWCASRAAPRYACTGCGRWMHPDAAICPDPECSGAVMPIGPQHTGRRWDLKGTGAGWSWPDWWDERHPLHQTPRIERWQADSVIHAAAVAHGRLTLWSGAGLVAPAGAIGRVLPRDTDSETALTESGAGDSGYSRGSAAPRPAVALPVGDRMAVAGGGLVLATDRGFSVASLWNLRSERLELDAPLGQAADPHWWIGWTAGLAGPALHVARIGRDWDQLAQRPVELPEGAALSSYRRVAVRSGHAYWIGADSALWELDCESRAVSRLVDPVEGACWVWAEADGPRLVRQAGGYLYAAGSAPVNGRIALEMSAGAGPLRGLFAAPSLTAVVGERIQAFDRASGDRVYDGRIAGRWVTGALVPAEDGEPRLLTLTVDGDNAQLRGLRLSSGREELLWQERAVNPLALLPVGDSLFIVHENGLVQLKEEAK